MLPVNILNVLAAEEDEARQNELEEYRANNLERHLMRDASDPFTMNDEHFRELFRLNKEMARYVYDAVVPSMVARNSAHAITPILRYFAALYFFATGSYQRSVGQSYNISMSQQSVSRAIEEVSEGIVNTLAQRLIKFPTGLEEKAALKRRFMEATNFPGTIGAIDCTHVAILAPVCEEHNYLNRKGFHSKNVQVPGGLNDSIFFTASRFVLCCSGSGYTFVDKINVSLSLLLARVLFRSLGQLRAYFREFTPDTMLCL